MALPSLPVQLLLTALDLITDPEKIYVVKQACIALLQQMRTRLWKQL